MSKPGKVLCANFLAVALLTAQLAAAQEGSFLQEEEAPRAVFPEGTSFERKIIHSSAELRQKIQQRLGKTKTSTWEDAYVTFTVKKANAVIGYAVIVEEIGKHRPITFVVGVGSDRRIKDAALMVYREAFDLL